MVKYFIMKFTCCCWHLCTIVGISVSKSITRFQTFTRVIEPANLGSFKNSFIGSPSDIHALEITIITVITFHNLSFLPNVYYHCPLRYLTIIIYEYQLIIHSSIYHSDDKYDEFYWYYNEYYDNYGCNHYYDYNYYYYYHSYEDCYCYDDVGYDCYLLLLLITTIYYSEFIISIIYNYCHQSLPISFISGFTPKKFELTNKIIFWND